MELTQYREIFEMLKHGPEDVISTEVFVKAFRENMAMDSAKELNDLVACLDPLATGQITFEQFLIAMKKIYANQDHQGDNDSPKETITNEEKFNSRTSPAGSVSRKAEVSIENNNSSNIFETPPSNHSSPSRTKEHSNYDHSSNNKRLNKSKTESLISFGDALIDDDDHDVEFVKFEKSNYSGDEATKPFDDELLDCEQLSSSPHNMSVLDNQSVREEHYEFTPSPESGSKRHADFAGDDTDFSCTSNGDSSYHSLKSPSFGQRNTWLRSSLRRNGSSLKRNGSLATNYRNSPTQDRVSSRRSSLSYESDEMIAGDCQLEEDVQNLNDKLKKLQDQVELLTNAHERSESKYSNMLRENNNLNDKINYLEEQIRDFDLKSEQRSAEDEKRHREAMERLAREKAQETESIMEQFLSAQKELISAQNDIKLSQQQIDQLKSTKVELETRLQDRDYEIVGLKEEIGRYEETIQKKISELEANAALIEALNRELSTVKTQSLENKQTEINPNVEILQRNQELEQQLRMIKQENSELKEANDELTAQVLNNHLIEGKNLLKEADGGSSLAAELGDLNIEELKTKLKDKEEETAKLREYIDKMLEKIVLHYPKLLEVSND